MEQRKLTIESAAKSKNRSSAPPYKTVVLSNGKEYIVDGFTEKELETYRKISQADPEFFPVSISPDLVEQKAGGYKYFVEWVPDIIGLVDNKFPTGFAKLNANAQQTIRDKKEKLLAVLRKMPVADMCLLVSKDGRVVLVDYEETSVKGNPAALITGVGTL